MGLFDRISEIFTRSTDRHLDEIRSELKDIKASIGSGSTGESVEETVKEKRRTISKPLQYSTPSTTATGRGKSGQKIFHGPAYDLSEIARAMDVEPYVNQSVRKHREQVLKEGFRFVGNDPEAVDYVHKRLFEMYLVSGITTETIVREFVTNLIAFATAFLVLKRDIDKSSGQRIKLYGRTLDPIAAIFPMDPTCVTVSLNKHGHPTEWLQKIEDSATLENEARFSDSDIVIATIDKRPGFIFGAPYILPTLDDVRSLRRLEELAEIAGAKYAYPPYHFKVGEKDDGPQTFDDGTSEIDIVKEEVENMRPEGGLVTSHRVNAEVLGGAKDVFDFHPYLEYFEQRVLGGLRLSLVDLGRGNISKGSSVQVSQSLQDSARDIQVVAADAITYQLLIPLLLEGGFNVDHTNLVSIEFSRIDREEERASQQHGMDMFNNSTITCEEFRREFLKKDPIPDDKKSDVKSEIEHKHTLEEIKSKPAAGSSSSSSSSKSKAGKNTTRNKTRPRNQSGTKSTKTKVKANDYYNYPKQLYVADVCDLLQDCKSAMKDFAKKHGVGVKASEDVYDANTKREEMRSILDSFVIITLAQNRAMLDSIVQDGIEDAMHDMQIEGVHSIPKKAVDRFFKNYIEKSLNSIMQMAESMIEEDEVLAGMDTTTSPLVAMSSIFNQIETEIDALLPQHIDFAYRFGYVRTLKSHGRKSFILRPVPDMACEECCEDGDIQVSLAQKDIPYSQVLRSPHSEFDCTFEVTTKGRP